MCNYKRIIYNLHSITFIRIIWIYSFNTQSKNRAKQMPQLVFRCKTICQQIRSAISIPWRMSNLLNLPISHPKDDTA